MEKKVYKHRNAAGALDVIAVGKFSGNYPTHLGDGYGNTLDFKFDMIRIEWAGLVN